MSELHDGVIDYVKIGFMLTGLMNHKVGTCEKASDVVRSRVFTEGKGQRLDKNKKMHQLHVS